MDAQRFEELKHTITNGGLPNVSNETFTEDQIKELKPLLKERADASISYGEALKEELDGE